MIPLSIDIDGDLSLSRALKRKFIELEEITQRLKARLFDVTGDEDVDPDDEFERDLNTVAMEDEDFEEPPANVASTSADFGWLGVHKDPFHVESNEFQEVLMQSFNRPRPVGPIPTNTSGSLPSERPTVSGCSSNRDLQDNLDSLLRNHDIDTLINPNLFKDLLDPLVSASSDTSSLIQKPVPGVASSSESSLTSAETSGRESIQFIENALQKAALVETETRSRTSGGGDGESGGG
jgi:C2 domain-containing protein 3